MNIVTIIKGLIALQQLISLILDTIVEREKDEHRRECGEAVQAAKHAKTKEERLAAYRRIENSFRARSAYLKSDDAGSSAEAKKTDGKST